MNTDKPSNLVCIILWKSCWLGYARNTGSSNGNYHLYSTGVMMTNIKCINIISRRMVYPTLFTTCAHL